MTGYIRRWLADNFVGTVTVGSAAVVGLCIVIVIIGNLIMVCEFLLYMKIYFDIQSKKAGNALVTPLVAYYYIFFWTYTIIKQPLKI